MLVSRKFIYSIITSGKNFKGTEDTNLAWKVKKPIAYMIPLKFTWTVTTQSPKHKKHHAFLRSTWHQPVYQTLYLTFKNNTQSARLYSIHSICLKTHIVVQWIMGALQRRVPRNKKCFLNPSWYVQDLFLGGVCLNLLGLLLTFHWIVSRTP